jgi:2-hydroxychromene-2-carboxylate isomerase
LIAPNLPETTVMSIDYYFATQSPWAYLGHARFASMAAAAGAAVNVRPVDFGKVFAVSGGLPLGQRALQRQAYRLVELARWRDHLGMPMNVKPRYFPVAGDNAARLIIAVDRADGAAAAMNLTGRVMAAVWLEERDIHSTDTLAQLLAEAGLSSQRVNDAQAPDVQAAYERHTQQAIEAQVFGAPSYVVNGEIFWGQDRLEFLQRRLLRP